MVHSRKFPVTRSTLLLGCVGALAAASILPTAFAGTERAKFFIDEVGVTSVAGGKTKVSVKYRIKCPGNRFKAGIGFASSDLDVFTIKNGWVKKRGRVSKSFNLKKGVYTAGAAYVRCYDGDEYVRGAFPPQNRQAQKRFTVK